jgi:hypothetical protein
MHGFFCPKCGEALRYAECRKQGRWEFEKVLCPRCLVQAERSGGVFFLLGLFIIVGGSDLMPLEDVSLVIGSGFCVFGSVRLVRQFRTAKAFVSSHKDAARG